MVLVKGIDVCIVIVYGYGFLILLQPSTKPILTAKPKPKTK